MLYLYKKRKVDCNQDHDDSGAKSGCNNTFIAPKLWTYDNVNFFCLCAMDTKYDIRIYALAKCFGQKCQRIHQRNKNKGRICQKRWNELEKRRCTLLRPFQLDDPCRGENVKQLGDGVVMNHLDSRWIFFLVFPCMTLLICSLPNGGPSSPGLGDLLRRELKEKRFLSMEKPQSRIVSKKGNVNIGKTKLSKRWPPVLWQES